MFDNNTENYKMKNLVDISAMVTQSLNFFEIKDKIIEKMLEVVHPTKACVNLFYKNNYEYAYLVCSETLDKIPDLFDINTTFSSPLPSLPFSLRPTLRPSTHGNPTYHPEPRIPLTSTHQSTQSPPSS